MCIFIYAYTWCIIHSLVHSSLTRSPNLRSFFWALGRPLGLPAWPAGPSWPSVLPPWASVLPFLAFRTPFGRQVDASWTPIGRQLDCQNSCHCQRTSEGRQDSCQVPQNALPTVFLSPDGDICNTSIYIYIYTHINTYIYIYIY